MGIKIYRLEDRDGFGCHTKSIYDGGVTEFERELLKFQKKINKNHKTYPSWYLDYSKELYEQFCTEMNIYLSACPSLEILKKWYRDFLPVLIENGFNIYEYTVNTDYVFFSISNKQVVFNKNGIINKIKYGY